MKLKAPWGVGDPCVGGVTVTPRDGHYDVEPEVAALLIECFGFAVVEESAAADVKAPPARRRGKPAPRKI
jgi:hypothetical protein